MKSVLILGNGISRLLFKSQILAWEGEIWACNYAFREFGTRISRLSGHQDVLEEAAQYRDEHGLTYEIWAGIKNLSAREGFHEFTCPAEFRKDTGTTLVAQALHEGYDVQVCGFDLGGPDVISPNLHEQNKKCWVSRWRKIFEKYGHERVTFWGHDHKKYLLSGSREDLYYRYYHHRRPHIDYPGYDKLFVQYVDRADTAHILHYREDPMMRVRFTVTGKETEMTDTIARIYEGRGKVKILGPVEVESGEQVPDAPVLSNDELVDALYTAGLATKKSMKGWSREQLVEVYEDWKRSGATTD